MLIQRSQTARASHASHVHTRSYRYIRRDAREGMVLPDSRSSHASRTTTVTESQTPIHTATHVRATESPSVVGMLPESWLPDKSKRLHHAKAPSAAQQCTQRRRTLMQMKSLPPKVALHLNTRRCSAVQNTNAASDHTHCDFTRAARNAQSTTPHYHYQRHTRRPSIARETNPANRHCGHHTHWRAVKLSSVDGTLPDRLLPFNSRDLQRKQMSHTRHMATVVHRTHQEVLVLPHVTHRRRHSRK
jgi:hypothetical protein